MEVEVLPDGTELSGELQGTVNLEDLDRAGVESIVANLLAGDYLSRPGIGERDDALLFLLVNEAIHVLEQIAAAEAHAGAEPRGPEAAKPPGDDRGL